MKNLMALTLLSTSLLSTSGFALTQKFNLNMQNSHLKKQSVIGLKKEIKRQKGVQVKSWSLQSATILAKSKKGLGKAKLLVNGLNGESKVIPGVPELFQSPSEGFSSLTLAAPKLYRGERPMAMKLSTKGNIKLKSVQVILKKKLHPRLMNVQKLPLSKVASLKAAKVVGSSKTIFPRGLVKGIAVTGKKGNVKINKVVLIKRNGQKIILDEMQGSVKQNRTKGIILPRGMQTGIVKIKVVATSKNIFGSRGKIDIKLAQ